MADDAQERTEQPTQKRLEEARKHGQVPRSRELNTAAVVLIAGIGLHFMGAQHGHAAVTTSCSRAWRCRANRCSMRTCMLADSGGTLLAGPSGLRAASSASRCSPRSSHRWPRRLESELRGAGARTSARLNPIGGLQRMFSLRGRWSWPRLSPNSCGRARSRCASCAQKPSELMGLGAEPHRVSPSRTPRSSPGPRCCTRRRGTGSHRAPWMCPGSSGSTTSSMRMSRQEIARGAQGERGLAGNQRPRPHVHSRSLPGAA